MYFYLDSLDMQLDIDDIQMIDMQLDIDDIQMRLTRTEDQLEDAMARIAKLENKMSNNSAQHVSSKLLLAKELRKQEQEKIDEQIQQEALQASLQSANDDIYSISSDDDLPPLPPPVNIQSNVTLTPHRYTYPQYSYQSPFDCSPEQSSPARPPLLHPMQPSNYYNPQSTPGTWTPPCMQPSTGPPPPPSTVPPCLPIKGRRKNDKQSNLPSVEINKENLILHEMVVSKNQSLCRENVVGTLAAKLVNESFFGNEVLKRCTVMGCRDYPTLPLKELNELKQVIFLFVSKVLVQQL